jgi:hypothetical protein
LGSGDVSKSDIKRPNFKSLFEMGKIYLFILKIIPINLSAIIDIA